MTRTIIAAIVSALAFAACTDPDTICFDDEIYADDVFGMGRYKEYLERFQRETGCESRLNCEGHITIRRCIDNVEFE